jgi:hypothetical protein
MAAPFHEMRDVFPEWIISKPLPQHDHLCELAGRDSH